MSARPSSPLPASREPLPPGDAPTDRPVLLALFLSGISMSMLGAVLPGWRYHLEASFGEVADCFLSVAVGFVLSSTVVHTLLQRRTVRDVLGLANALACSGFLVLAWSPAIEARSAGLFLIGGSIGLSSAVMFRTITPADRRGSTTTANLAGLLFGSGCLLTAAVAAASYSTYPATYNFAILGVLSGSAAVWFARAKHWSGGPIFAGREIWRDFKNPGAVLFGLLFLFQFGNEWSIAGWLPLFLIRRLGISPSRSLLILAFYWVVLFGGRPIARWILPRVSASGLLAGSILSAILGSVVLASTNNGFGAVMGVLFVGAGFAPIFPLAIRKIEHRFPDRRAVFSGFFSIAILGGLLAPWLVSFFASAWGVQAVMFFPMAGICVVFLLMLLVMLEAKLSGWTELKDADSSLHSAGRIDQLNGSNGVGIAHEVKE